MIDISELKDLIIFGKYANRFYGEFMELENRTISEEDLLDLVTCNRTYSEIFESNDPLTMVGGTFSGNLHVKPEHLVRALEVLMENNYDYGTKWIVSMLQNDDSSKHIYPNDLRERYIGDYYFDDDDHLVNYVFLCLNTFVDEINYKETLNKIYSFLVDILSNRGKNNNRSFLLDNTVSFILNNMSSSFDMGDTTNEEMNTYFVRNLELLASKNNVIALELLGYQYYEGSSNYRRDPKQALDLFLKAYEIGKNPDIARTIGYIYYYGYHNDHRVPDYKEAFKYFITSYTANGNHESACKVADCFSNGRGVDTNYEAAYSILSPLYTKSLRRFRDGEFLCKFPDIALRLASYKYKGTGTEIDVEDSLMCAYKARAAIKKRIEYATYIGDKKVALSIENLINEIEHTVPNRVIEDNGYVIDVDDQIVQGIGFHKQYEVSADVDGIHLYIPSKEIECFYNIVYSNKLRFVEVTRVIHILFKGLYDLSLLDSIEEDPEFYLDFKDNTLVLSKPYTDEKFEMDIDKIVYFPSTLKTLDRAYMLVQVEFESGGKLYEYLCMDKDVKVGDSLYAGSSNPKRVVVVNKKEVYEDQLPLPLKNMSIAYKK